jgi:WD40 repeat protein
MDYVEGRSLAAIIRENPLPARAAAAYCQSIARAIAYAHGHGIIHRDLKPSNVMVDIFDQVRVTDFGLAKLLDGSSDVTHTGQLVGSPNYLSPELAAGKQREASVVSDVYSIGAVLYECLTGRPPFLAESLQQTLIKIRDTEVPPPRLLQPRIPRDLETICLKCLEKEPQKRYADAQELSNDLQRFLKSEPIHARPVGLLGKGWRWCQRKPGLATALAAANLLLLVVLSGGPGLTYRINQALKRAEAGEFKARRLAYAADMQLAHQAVTDGDFFRALQKLKAHRPSKTSGSPNSKPGTDLRGWEWRYLWKQCQGEEDFILGYHSNGVSAAGFLSDGKTAYSAGNDKVVRLWDIESKRQVGFFPHESPVTVCAFSPDGRWMATSTEAQPSSEGVLRLWDLQNKRASVVLTTNFCVRPDSMLFSPDSKLLAFVDVGVGVHLWDVARRCEVTKMPAYFHFQEPLGIAISADSRTLAYCENEGGDIVLWDIPSQSRKSELKGHRLWVTSLAFTPDGRALVSSSVDRTAKLWNLADGPGRGSFTNLSSNAQYSRMSPDGTVLATSSSDHLQRIRLQEIPSGVPIRELIGHQDLLTEAAFSPDGTSIITASADGSVRLWSVRPAPKPKESRPYSGTVGKLADGKGTALCPSPDGRNLLVVYADDTFSLWETVALSESARQPLPIAGFRCAALAPGAKTAAFVGEGGKVILWRADSTNREQFSLVTKDDLSRAVFSADGQRLAIGGWHDILVFDVLSKTQISQFHFRPEASPEDFVVRLSFSPDGQKLLAGFAHGKFLVWDFARHVGHNMKVQAGVLPIRGLGILADGQTLVSAGQQVSFWNLNLQREISSFRPRSIVCEGYTITPDGRRLAVGVGNGLITIWDLESLQEVATLKGHERRVLDLFFLRDGNTLVSISLDEVRVWRAPSLNEADEGGLR